MNRRSRVVPDHGKGGAKIQSRIGLSDTDADERGRGADSEGRGEEGGYSTMRTLAPGWITVAPPFFLMSPITMPRTSTSPPLLTTSPVQRP